MDSRPPLLIEGMHGLGDNVHQRAIIRALMKRYSVTLETSWPCIYHDMPELRLVRRPVALRTQLKNAEREKAKFGRGPAPHHHIPKVHPIYGRGGPGMVGDGTILQAMFKSVGIAKEYAEADFTLPIPIEWYKNDHIKQIMRESHPRKLLVYRPLVERPEWRGSGLRNANAEDYAEIFAAIRDEFFVVSVADLEDGREWIVGPRLKADVELHKGELTFETLAALFHLADMVYTSSGFGAVLAPAVRTACISIQGGFEPASWHADGAKFAPYLGIDPIKPCACASSGCMNNCTKKVDVPSAIRRIREFCGFSLRSEYPGSAEYHAPAVATPTHKRIVQGAPRLTHPQLLAQMQRNRGVKA